MWSGVDFVIIDNEGNVGYCDDFRPDKDSLGNVLDGTFRPFIEPHPFPGKFVSDGTVDGVANFVELDYLQLTGNNVLSFSRQGGVYHTGDGVYYKNTNTDFNDSRVRAEYHFPARNLKDAWAILTHKGDPLPVRLSRLTQSVFPGTFSYRNPATPRAVLFKLASCIPFTRSLSRVYKRMSSNILKLAGAGIQRNRCRSS